MKSLKTVIVGFAFLLSGTIGYAAETLSKSIILTSNHMDNEVGFMIYIFIPFMIIGVTLLIKGLRG